MNAGGGVDGVGSVGTVDGDGGAWDVAVVGAGPAGSAAALAVLQEAPGARVVLLDRAAFPRDKVCGDGVAPHALDVLAALGVDVAALVAGHPPVDRLRLEVPERAAGTPHVPGRAAGAAPRAGGAAAVVADRRMRRPAHVVPRRVLDARLVEEACRRGAVLRRHTVRRVEERGGWVEVDACVRARVLVAADGAGSTVVRGLGLAGAPASATALALRAYAPVAASRADAQVIAFAEGRAPAYAWSFPVGDGSANVGFGASLAGGPLRRAQLQEQLDRLLPGASDGATGWRGHHLPLATARPHQPDGRVLLAGDAAHLVNPVTGEGIFYAAVSGALAGRAAANALAAGADGATAGARYRASLQARLGRHLRHLRLAAALSASPALVRGVVARCGRDGAVFDDLVELGLADGLVTRRVAAAAALAAAGTARERALRRRR